MACNINWIKIGCVGDNWSFSGTYRTSYISKNLNIYPHQSRITLYTLLWDTLYSMVTSRTHCGSLIFTDFLARNVWAQAQKTVNKAYHTNTRGNYQKICVETKPGKVKGNLHPEIVSDIIQWLKFENFLQSCPFVEK